MEGVVVTAATGALKPVLEKLVVVLGDEYKRFKEVRKEIKFLSTELTAMEAFLVEKSEDENPNAQDRAWMMEVRELSYDIEDSLDEFMLRVDDISAKPDGFMDKIKNLLSKTIARRQIAKKIEKLKTQVKEVADRNARYRTVEAISMTKNAMVDPRALVIFKDASNLIGIDEPKNEVIKLLSEEDGCESTQQQVKIVSIVGFGGMGKTTLANEVYKELKGKYDCSAFVSASRNPNMIEILRTILSEVTDQEAFASTEAGNVQQLIKKIANFLADKKYFIVVDDIWNVEIWETIKYALITNSRGSKIITTTRINDVAASCRASLCGHVYNIRPLTMVHSRQLFHRRLFNTEECPTHLEEVSKLILVKCDGLPLAIIAISGLLANKESTKDQWDQVMNSIGSALERNHSIDQMISILALSYFDLPPHLKTCLLYLSIFPEDYIINKKELIRRWISEGFIHKGRYAQYEFGEVCFNELINRSLIQAVGTSKYDQVKSCRVHDIILDFIISMATKENFVTLVGSPNLLIGTHYKVRRISLQFDKQGNSIIQKNLVLSHARSLSVFGSVEIPTLDEFRCLRVVHFGIGYHELQSHHLTNIGRMFQLRYLSLRGLKGVGELSERVGCLRYLEMLDIRDTDLCELPVEIARLGKLVHLLTDNDVKFPDGIAKMEALEYLKNVNVYRQSSSFLQELGQLKNLRALKLSLLNHGMSEYEVGLNKERMEALASSLHKLSTHNLRSLKIVAHIPHDDIFLRELRCPPPIGLRKLCIFPQPMVRVPNWVGALVNLRVLHITVKEFGQEEFCAFGCLPALLTLRIIIHGHTFIKGGLTVHSCDGFRCLRNLFVHGEHFGMQLMFEAGSMPKLEKLDIGFNATETESVTSGGFDFGIKNLTFLIKVECTIFYYGRRTYQAVEDARAALKRAVSTHPNQPSLRIDMILRLLLNPCQKKKRLLLNRTDLVMPLVR